MIKATLFLALLTTALRCTPAQQAPAATSDLSGKLLDCANGKPLGIGGIDVYIYELPEADNLLSALKETEKVRAEANDGAAAHFFAAYDRVEKLVRSHKFSGRHSVTDSQGRFAIRDLRPGQSYLFLAIGFNVEDEPTYYVFRTLNLHAGTNRVTEWMAPDAKSRCAKP